MAEMKIDVFAPGKGPDLSCGRDYTVQATVTQKVESCEEVDFNDLYDLVEKMVDAECQAVTCTVPCNRLGPFILGQTWSCANSLAEVSLAKRVFCSKDTTSNFPYPQRPTQQDLRKKGSGGSVPDPKENDHASIPRLEIPPCGKCVDVVLTYTTPVAECKAVTDFAPYVKSADERADTFVASVKCAGVCVPKVENREHKTECEKNQVIVVVKFKLCCVKPAAPKAH